MTTRAKNTTKMITRATNTKTFNSIDEAIEYILGTEYTVNHFNYFVRELEENYFLDLGDTIIYIDNTKTK